MTGGRKMIAPTPVPVGWELEPVTDGSLIADMTKVKAPAAPSSRRALGLSRTMRAALRVPWMTKGAATAVHAAAWTGGRKPSAMCISALSLAG